MSKSESVIKIAERVQSHVASKDEKFGFDPMTILAIVNIILTICRIIYECRKNREAVRSGFKQPNLFYRLMLKRAVRKNFKSKQDRENVYAACLDVGATLSEKEISELIQEVEKDK